MFAGLVDGGAPGNVGVRVWGTKPADPKVVAPIAGLLGAPALTQTTFVRVRGYPAQLGLAVDKYAQLRRYAQEAFGLEVTIRVHRCTQLAHSTLDRPVFDLELEGVPEDWQDVRLGAPDTRFPDRLWERTTRSSRQGRYQPVGPGPKDQPGGIGAGPAAASGGPGNPGPHGGPSHGQRGAGSGRHGRGGQRHSLMFLALVLLTFCVRGGLPVMADEGLGDELRGGRRTTTPPGALPGTPVTGNGGYGSGSSPGDPPLGTAPGIGPPARQEGVYTPTAHEGAPG